MLYQISQLVLGSPVVTNEGGAWIQVAIVSYGVRDPTKNVHEPSVNTDVSYYRDWINAR